MLKFNGKQLGVGETESLSEVTTDDKTRQARSAMKQPKDTKAA